MFLPFTQEVFSSHITEKYFSLLAQDDFNERRRKLGEKKDYRKCNTLFRILLKLKTISLPVLFQLIPLHSLTVTFLIT